MGMQKKNTVEKKELGKFYAVTMTSVYKAVAVGEGVPYLEKIARRDKASPFRVGARIENGTMISVGANLYMFVPEGCGPTSPNSTVEREIARVNTRYWGGHTARIVALFLKRKDALLCNRAENLVANDSRWREQTIEVLRAIKDDHMYFSITTWHEFELIPASEWRQPPPV
jgi:hypothetical protein